ncbi:putative nuclear membrane fusion protein kar5 protein [Eutypa lata UCREL1]|uniref:Putative nuclear membrane fusion protein kar5 protein n=1 Tax=Eutypa lata (strain UCR-EL1) TaxID=1287681 RepID=M7SJ33_EUTLA|nr:putative nuclear membrane fusion protein kar5 protein [Eutypa lata UCREL1]
MTSQVAARLLVNNCELLEGKDEATVLTDSGRQIRDFVDSYAASLAICDLERGSFVIPKECAKFREPVLGQMPIGNEVYLHVTSTEIDACLSGLGVSDSAWNTWVSYRHKALRFCDAARADNDKAQHIRLFQKLTKIMNQMTNSVDQELETRLRDFDRRSQEATNKIDNLSPTVDRIGQGLRDIESIISEVLPNTLMVNTPKLMVFGMVLT